MNENTIPKSELTVVTVTYSFSEEVVAFVFDNYQSACDFMKEDFENEKRIDIENGHEIDETNTILETDRAVLATEYITDGFQTTTWTIATTIDKRK